MPTQTFYLISSDYGKVLNAWGYQMPTTHPKTYDEVHDTLAATGQGYPMAMIGQNIIYNEFVVYRSALVFDTSALPTAAFVTDAYFRGYCDILAGISQSVVLVRGSDIDEPPVLADYGDLLDETASRGSISSADLVLKAYNDISLNALGKSEIIKGGHTKFGMRSSRDISSIQNSGDERIRFTQYGSIYLQLIITYTIGGFIWVEETKLRYIAEDAERAFEGVITGATGTAGHLWVEGTYLHYIDQNGDERRQEGTAEGAIGVAAGHIWIEAIKLRYIDASNDERYIEGAVV